MNLILCGLLAACGPSAMADDDGTGDGGAGGVDARDPNTGPVGRITGTIWAPGNAPGLVPAGQEIPIFAALVTLTTAPLAPIPQEVYCETCVEPQGKHTFTDHKGNFSLDNVVPNNYYLTIQKGQFRLEQQITVGAEQTVQLTAPQSMLPSEHDPTNGKYIPKMAIAIGNYDDLQDILGKMAIGAVSSTGAYADGSAPMNLHIYDNGGSYTGTKQGSLASLVGDLAKMKQYHIIYIPCASTSNTSALTNQQNLKNIRDYVAAGGKLYVTDWSGEWMDNVFPTQITLGDSGTDTPASAYDATNDSWNTAQFGDADGSLYESDNAEAADADLRAWLDGQMGPTALSAGQSTFDASNFVVEGNWNWIPSLNQVQVGVDDENLPLYDTPKAWVIGGRGSSNPTPKHPLTVSFEPVGCGRVLYSTYHTTDNTHTGLVPQERVLLYLIMEIGVCNDAPVVD
jgi:hypothetical protein